MELPTITDLINAAPQYVALILFVAYTIWRDKGWREFLEQQNLQWRDHLEKETRVWVQAIADDRRQRREVMQHAYKTMEDMGSGLGQLSQAFSEHDKNAELRHTKVMAAVARLTEASSYGAP